MNENVYFECRKRAAIHNERLNSRAGAAEILGISESTLAHYELGITKNIPVDVVVMMAEVYNAPELKCIYCKSECPIGKELPIATEAGNIEGMKRIFGVGSLTQGVVAEKHTVDLETRMSHAASFNDEKMNYVLNAYVNEQGKEIDGYQTAARLAGMIGACASNSSLTHTVVSGFSEILERLTNTQMIAAEKKGCIVLSYSSAKQVWIDNAINTLITPADNQDDGWKKIRRVKTRFELIRRMNAAADALVGKVDNDKDGRSTVVSQLQAIGDNMIAEGKLTAITVSESAVNVADGDSAWFDIDVVDKDSMEHIYLSYRFQFSTNA